MHRVLFSIGAYYLVISEVAASRSQTCVRDPYPNMQQGGWERETGHTVEESVTLVPGRKDMGGGVHPVQREAGPLHVACSSPTMGGGQAGCRRQGMTHSAEHPPRYRVGKSGFCVFLYPWWGGVFVGMGPLAANIV